MPYGNTVIPHSSWPSAPTSGPFRFLRSSKSCGTGMADTWPKYLPWRCCILHTFWSKLHVATWPAETDIAGERTSSGKRTEIPVTVECGIQVLLTKNPEFRLSRIQNPRLSWIYLHFGDRLSVDSRPTVHRQTTNSRPIDYNELWFVPHFFRLNNMTSSF